MKRRTQGSVSVKLFKHLMSSFGASHSSAANSLSTLCFYGCHFSSVKSLDIPRGSNRTFFQYMRSVLWLVRLSWEALPTISTHDGLLSVCSQSFPLASSYSSLLSIIRIWAKALSLLFFSSWASSAAVFTTWSASRQRQIWVVSKSAREPRQLLLG